jgi:transcriptional regulator of acetoin/glycerol metabolism
MGFSASDCSFALRHRRSTLIVGPVSATEAVLLTLGPSLTGPVTRWQPGADLVLPAGGTLVLRNVSELTSTEQSALRDWLEQDHRRTQVISTAAQSVVPLVERGLFSDVLYYRLNLVYIELPDA